MNVEQRLRAGRTGEVVVGTQSPGPDWVKADGSVISGADVGHRLKSALLTDGYLGLQTWSVFPANSAAALTSAAYGAGTWVIGGSNLTYVVNSTDLISWTTSTLNAATGSAYTVVFGQGIFVAAGSAGQLRTSTDGLSWTTRASTFGTSIIRDVAYDGSGLWVAVGAGGALRTSTDAITWATQTSTFGTSTINAVEYANSLWVAVGAGGTIRTSTNGTTWTTRTSGTTTELFSIAYGNGKWMAGAAPATAARVSTDGTTWTSGTLSNARGIVWVPEGSPYFGGTSLWVAVGGSGSSVASFNVSTDAVTWVTINDLTAGSTNVYFQGVAYANGQFVIGGTQASLRIVTPDKARLPSSTLGSRIFAWVHK